MRMTVPDRKNDSPYPTEFVIPHRNITPEEILFRLKGFESEIRVLVAGRGGRVAVAEGFPVNKGNGTGEAYVYWNGAMERLNGSYMKPVDLLRFLKPVGTSRGTAELLMADTLGSVRAPRITLRSDDGLVSVNVFSGARSDTARTISEIGSRGSFTPEERRIYQTALYDVYRPILARPLSVTKTGLGLKDSVRLFHEIEDCAATGDTLAGMGFVLERLQSPFEGRRIDLGVATGQALTILTWQAQRMKVPTEINVGYMAWGLSEGIGPNLEHKNYITHPPFQEFRKVFGETIFVVGDMGEAAKRTTGVPWDSFRLDSWGRNEKQSVDENFYSQYFERSTGGLRVGYANGGLLTVAFLEYEQLPKEVPTSTIMAVGKRLDSPIHGFAFRLDHFLEPYRTILDR